MTGRSGGIDVLRTLGERTLMFPTYAPAIDFDGGKYGVGMLSKEKPVSYRYIALPGRRRNGSCYGSSSRDISSAARTFP